MNRTSVTNLAREEISVYSIYVYNYYLYAIVNKGLGSPKFSIVVILAMLTKVCSQYPEWPV